MAFAAGGAPSAHAGGGQGEVYDLRVVSLTGDPAPGVFAGSFVAFDRPAMNASGQVVFAAQTDGPLVRSAMVATAFDDPSQLRLLAGENLIPPGVPGTVRYAEFEFPYIRPSITQDGEIAFWARLDGYPGDPRGGIFRFDGDAMEPVVVPDQAVPGLPGATFDAIVNLDNQSAGGLSTFRAFLAGPGITEANDDALFVEWIGGLNMFLRKGGAAPGLPGRTWAPYYSFATPKIAANGRMTFQSIINGGGLAGEALWTGFPGAFEPLVVTGDILPNGRPFQGAAGLRSFTSNDAGSVVARVIHGLPIELRSGIFRFENGQVTTVADADTAGPLGTYASLGDGVVLAGDGSTFFVARFAGPADTADTAIIRRSPGQAPVVMLREGDAAFGSGPGVVFDDFINDNAVFTSDGPGRLYVQATLRGPGINNGNDDGVWMIDTNGSISLILRGQQGVTVAPFDTRFVSDVDLRGGAGSQSGNRGAVNDRGDVALRVDFSDGSQAIVHAFLPPFCPADRNGDGFITFDDLLIVLGDFENTGPVGTGGDADWDGDTDFSDLLIILGAFGSDCSPA